MLTPLQPCIRFQVELIIAVNNLFLVVISSLLPDFLRTGPPSLLLYTVFHAHTLQILAASLEYEIMPLAFIGGPGWSGSLSLCQ